MTEEGAIKVDELRSVLDAIAAKGGESPDQRLKRLVAEVVKGLGEPVSKPVRALIRTKILADDNVRDLRAALSEIQVKYDHQQRAQQKLQELARELSVHNKTIKAQYEEQFRTQRQQQEVLRNNFQTAMAEIEDRIRASTDEQEATRKNHEVLQGRIQAVLDMEQQQRKCHAQQTELKDQEVALLQTALQKAQSDLEVQTLQAQSAQAQIGQYAKKFELVQTSMRENSRAFQDLKKHVSNANHRNKAVVKENYRLSAELEAKTRELAVVKAQFEKFLRRRIGEKGAESGSLAESS